MKNVVRFKGKKPSGKAERPNPAPAVISFRRRKFRKKLRAAGARARKCLNAGRDAAYRFGDMLFSILMTMVIGVLGMLAAMTARALEFLEKRRNL